MYVLVMNTTHHSDQNPTDQNPTDETPDGDAAQLLTRRLAVLDELCAVGMAVVRELPKHAAVTGEDAAVGEVGLTFSRVSRSIRQIIALEQELTGAKEDQKRYARNRLDRERKDAISRGVKRAIRNAERIRDPKVDRDRLREGVENLFDDYDDYDDLDYRHCSVGEAISRICRELDIATDPVVWDDAGNTVSDEIYEARKAEAKAEAKRAKAARSNGDGAKADGTKSVFPDPPGVHHDEDEPPSRRQRPAANGPP